MVDLNNVRVAVSILPPHIHAIAIAMNYPRRPAMRTDRNSSINPSTSHDPLLGHESRLSNDHASPAPSTEIAVTQIKRRRRSDASDYSPSPRTEEDDPLPRLTIRIPAPRLILSKSQYAKSEKKLKKGRVKNKSQSRADDDGGFVCGLDGCTERFRRKYDVYRHRKRSARHGEKLLCGMCSKKLSRPDSLRRHMQRKHGVVWSAKEGEREREGLESKVQKRRLMSAGSEDDEIQALRPESAPEKMKIAFVMNPTHDYDFVDE